MKEYVLDANAVLTYLYSKESENSATLDRLIDLAERAEASLFISAINLGEAFYTLRKTLTEESALRLIEKVSGLVVVVQVNPDTAIQAAEMKHRYKLGYADSFAALLAINRKATLVSADPDFEKLGKALKWMKLRPYRSGI
jgi:predicted nucleic acid-binding protein